MLRSLTEPVINSSEKDTLTCFALLLCRICDRTITPVVALALAGINSFTNLNRTLSKNLIKRI